MDLKNIKFSDLNNIQLSDVKEKIANTDRKVLIKIGIGVGAFVLFLIIYYAILNPMVEERKIKYEDMTLKQNEVIVFNQEIQKIKKRIKDLQPKFENNSKLFHSKAELEDLYSNLSDYALSNGLTISKIDKKKQVPVLKEGIAQQSEENLKKNMISYYKIPVEYEIKGNFLNYIKFKRVVAKSEKMLNFDNEVISLIKNDANSSILVKGTLTIVGLPDEFF
jgi:Tfp pilus assembly protein PilO